MSEGEPKTQLSIAALEEEIKAMKYDPSFDIEQHLSPDVPKEEPIERPMNNDNLLEINGTDHHVIDINNEGKNDIRSKRSSSSSYVTGNKKLRGKFPDIDQLIYSNKPSTGNTRRYGALVGQLQWYTNEEDLSRYIHECGIDEIGSIKFYENRANGQSLGFAGVLLGTEKDLNKLLSRLPKRLIYGMKPLCVVLNKENVSKFTNIAEEFLGISKSLPSSSKQLGLPLSSSHIHNPITSIYPPVTVCPPPLSAEDFVTVPPPLLLPPPISTAVVPPAYQPPTPQIHTLQPPTCINSIVPQHDCTKVPGVIHPWPAPAATPIQGQFYEAKMEEIRTIWKNACEHSSNNIRKNAYREATQTLGVAIRLINDSPVHHWPEAIRFVEDLRSKIEKIEIIDSDGISTTGSSSSTDSRSSNEAHSQKKFRRYNDEFFVLADKHRSSNENSHHKHRRHHHHHHHAHRHRSKDAKIISLTKTKKSKRRKRQASEEYRSETRSRPRSSQPMATFETNGNLQYTTMGTTSSTMNRSFQPDSNHNSSHYYNH